MDPGRGGTICYRIIGNAPNRCFVAQWCDVPLFSDDCQPPQYPTFRGELRLCEDGSILINVDRKPTCTAWNEGGCLIGLVGVSTSDSRIVYNARPCPVLNNVCYTFLPPASCRNTPAPNCSPLSFVLEYFDGKYYPEGVYLSWRSAIEEGTRSYSLERSADRQHWEEIATFPARGHAALYTYLDKAHPRGYSSVYYRLRVESEKGEEQVYGPVEVVITVKRPTRPLQNLVRPGELPRFKVGDGEMVRVRIFDMVGRLLFEDTFCGPAEPEIPHALLGRGMITVLMEVVGGEQAAYQIVVF